MQTTFSVLGPLAVHCGDRVVTPPAAKPRALLACLALQPEPVSHDQLVVELWGDNPPRSAAANLRTYVAGLRTLIDAPDAHIRTAPDGYLLERSPDAVDAEVFRRLVLEVRQLAGDPTDALSTMDKALGLWRGRALQDVPLGPILGWQADRLEEERCDLFENMAQIRLDLGWHDDVLNGLQEHVIAHPLRERGHALLMLATYRAGDVVGALRAFGNARSALSAQLGIEPGPELAELHRAILNRDVGLAGPARGGPRPKVVPRQLPPAPATFVGRDAQLNLAMRAALATPRPGHSRVIAISGRAGVGKSALALRLAHDLDSFADGRIYLNLQGATPNLRPVSVEDALHRLLIAVGVSAADVPTIPAEAEKLWRSTIATRSMVVLLDDAVHAHQVLRLLPAAPGCLVVITSREALTELDQAKHIVLTPLSGADSDALLREITAGNGGVPTESVSQISRLCEYLPLALRVAGARLATALTHSGVGEFSARLAEERHRLDLLQLHETGVRSSLRVSLDQLRSADHPIDAAAGRVFPDLAAADLASFGGELLAQLLDVDEGTAAQVVDRLVALHLIAPIGADRYRIFDLLRLVAAEFHADMHSAIGKVHDYYLTSAWRASSKVRPVDLQPRVVSPFARSFQDPIEAAAWLETELPTLMGIARSAASHPVDGWRALELLVMLSPYLPSKGHWIWFGELGEAALVAAEHADDERGRALALTALAIVDRSRGEFDRALYRLARAYATHTVAGNSARAASALDWMGVVLTDIGQVPAAIGCYLRSLRSHQADGRTAQAGTTLHNIGHAYCLIGRYPAAARFLHRSLPLRRVAGDAFGEACTMSVIGEVLALDGRAAEALPWFDRGFQLARDIGYVEIEWTSAICRAALRGDTDLTDAAGAAARLPNPYAMALVDALRAGDPAAADGSSCRGPRPVLVERVIFRDAVISV